MNQPIDRTTFLQRAVTYKRVPVEADGFGTLWVRELSATEAKEFARRQTAANKAANADDAQLDLLVWTTVLVTYPDGETPTPLLTAADADAVKAMPIRVHNLIQDAVARVCGWKESAEAKKNA